MVRAELVKRSPVRLLERSTNGGLGAGNLGVIVGPKGVGKTACLVHIATDQLLQGKHVIHVSFRSDTSHILAWYEDIFSEIARRYSLDGAMDVHDAIICSRIVMNFRQDGVHWPQVEKSIRTLMHSSRFSTDAIVVDGYDFSIASPEEVQGVRRFAAEAGLEFWFSASTAEATQQSPKAVPGYLEPFLAQIAIVIRLINRGDHVHLELVKDHDNTPVSDLHLKLDPRILLLAEEE